MYLREQGDVLLSFITIHYSIYHTVAQAHLKRLNNILMFPLNKKDSDLQLATSISLLYILRNVVRSLQTGVGFHHESMWHEKHERLGLGCTWQFHNSFVFLWQWWHSLAVFPGLEGRHQCIRAVSTAIKQTIWPLMPLNRKEAINYVTNDRSKTVFWTLYAILRQGFKHRYNYVYLSQIENFIIISIKCIKCNT